MINPAQKRVMTKQIAVIANCEARSRKQSREPDSVRINDFVIIRNVLNEVKNLCGWLTFCYDAILHFVQNDR